MPDITLINLNMLFMRYGDQIERELHLPLGCLYLTTALEKAGFEVDFRDYQLCPSDTPFDMDVFLSFVENDSPVVGFSCMANLLPFTLLAMKAYKDRHPERTLALGGVGSKAVEDQILTRFPWVDVICRGEGELTAVELMRTLSARRVSRPAASAGAGGADAAAQESRRAGIGESRGASSPAEGGWGTFLSGVAGISWRDAAGVHHNPDRKRIADLDAIGFPAWEKVDLKRYAGYGMMTSRGCPYLCTFCSVAPVWDLQSFSRGPANIVREMKLLNEKAGVELFLFQDEFFISGKRQVMAFCDELKRSGLKVKWKAFGRVNLVDEEMMTAMANSGCVELRFGVESGSDAILRRVKKGFTAAQTLEVVPLAVRIFPRVDVFYIWGFPFETMEDFNQSLFQMVSFRMLGARILPSLLSLLPQTEVYRELVLDASPARRVSRPAASEGAGGPDAAAQESRRAQIHGQAALPTHGRDARATHGQDAHATHGRDARATLEFCPWLLPEFVFTGHEISRGGDVEIPERYRDYFGFIIDNPDIFPGFFHLDLEHNVLPKLALLRQFGFYPESQSKPAPAQLLADKPPESCGAHSPRTGPQEIATRA